MAIIYSIDPGMNNGVTVWHNGEYRKSFTLNPLELHNRLNSIDTGYIIIIEDSTLQSHVFTGDDKLPVEAKLKVARNIGEIDCYCKLIAMICKARGLKLVSISPKQKGKKYKTNKELVEATGIQVKTTNQHERDSVAIGFRFRNAK